MHTLSIPMSGPPSRMPRLCSRCPVGIPPVASTVPCCAPCTGPLSGAQCGGGFLSPPVTDSRPRDVGHCYVNDTHRWGPPAGLLPGSALYALPACRRCHRAVWAALWSRGKGKKKTSVVVATANDSNRLVPEGLPGPCDAAGPCSRPLAAVSLPIGRGDTLGWVPFPRSEAP